MSASDRGWTDGADRGWTGWQTRPVRAAWLDRWRTEGRAGADARLDRWRGEGLAGAGGPAGAGA
jgi:hypothetical protein